MSYSRLQFNRDRNEPAIIEALERCGVHVWRQLPVDLLCFYRGRFYALEVKEPKAKPDKRQRDQADFLALTGTPIVRSPEAALLALSLLSRQCNPTAKEILSPPGNPPDPGQDVSTSCTSPAGSPNSGDP